MDRVTEKLKQASGVAARANAALEQEADRLIAREGLFEQRKQEAFAPHYAILDMRNREMDQLEDALKIVGNADPLESSSNGTKQPEQPEQPVDQATPVPPLPLPNGSAALHEPGNE